MHWLTIAGFTLLCFIKCTAKSYRDHLLVHGTPRSENELQFFKELDTFYNVTFWRRPSLVDKPVEFSLSRINFAELNKDTELKDIEFLVIIRDLQSIFDSQRPQPYLRRRMESFNWKNYYSVEDIYNWLRDLEQSHPHDLQLSVIGQSVQKRHILAVKIEFGSVNHTRSTVIIEGGAHAREWISIAFVTYMIYSILNAKNSSDDDLREIAHSYIWRFVPLMNPDGYSYSQTTNRLWRKNYYGDYGVDLNRNFGVAFGKHGATTTQKYSEDYCGPEAFSEPETKALAAFISDNSKTLDYYVAFHSYGQYIIFPNTHMKEHTESFYMVKPYADQVAMRSLQKYNIRYSVGNAYDTVGYLASGSSIDWVKNALNVSYVMLVELPDQGFYGFALPKEQILPTCEATFDSLLPFFSSKTSLRLMKVLKNGVKQNNVLWLFVALSCGLKILLSPGF